MQFPLELDWVRTENALREFWVQAVDIWLDGGWAMIAIATISLVLFAVGMRVHLDLRAKRFTTVPERTWRRWIEHPRERYGPIGRLIDRAIKKPNQMAQNNTSRATIDNDI